MAALHKAWLTWIPVISAREGGNEIASNSWISSIGQRRLWWRKCPFKVIFKFVAQHADPIHIDCAASLNSSEQPRVHNCFCRTQVREVNIVWP